MCYKLDYVLPSFVGILDIYIKFLRSWNPCSHSEANFSLKKK